MNRAARSLLTCLLLFLPALTGANPPQEIKTKPVAAASYWRDPKTSLVWTVADNGSGVSWLQANRYCGSLRLGGFDDWRLPSIDELQGLFEKPVAAASDSSAFHVRGQLKLTGWQWSGTPGVQPGEGWAFDFGDGGRASVAAGDSGLNRALCVREERRSQASPF